MKEILYILKFWVLFCFCKIVFVLATLGMAGISDFDVLSTYTVKIIFLVKKSKEFCLLIEFICFEELQTILIYWKLILKPKGTKINEDPIPPIRKKIIKRRKLAIY